MSLNKKSVDDINVKGLRVLCRCHFNVPLKEGKITDENRLVAALPTIKKLIADGGKVILSDGTTETHGYFTLELLNNLGWCHSLKTTSYINEDDREIVVSGYSAGIKGSLTMDTLYLDIMKNWKNNQQNPVLYSTAESVNIIPAN